LGGDFKDGFKMALVSSSLRYVYNKMVKYDIDARAGSKGGAADIKGKKGPPNTPSITIIPCNTTCNCTCKSAF
jgi:hypothetical protein